MSYKSEKLCTAAFVGVLASLVISSPALAQSAATDSGIEDIIVTARKTAESAQSVPVTVTALSQAGLERQVVLNVQDLQTSVPGLFVAPNSQGGAPTFAIRAAKADNGTSATVTTYINDMPTFTTLAVANMVYDMQSVSTLKGPQGTLFGANSTGGAIIFRPNTPTNEFEGYLEAGLGNFDRRELEGVINLPVSDILQLRLAGNLVRRDGFITNLAPDALRGRSSKHLSNDRRESGRFSMRFEPSEVIQNDLMVSYFHEDEAPHQAIAVALRPRYDYNTFLGFAVPVDYARAGVTRSPDERHVSIGPAPTWNKAKIWDITNATTVTLSDTITAKLALGYENAKLDTFENNGATTFMAVQGRTTDDIRQFTVEPSVDVEAVDGRLRIKLGGFYSDARRITGNSVAVIDLPFDLTGFPPEAAGAVQTFLPLLNVAKYRRWTKSKALYSQWAFDISDTLTATFGARYTWDSGRYAASNFNSFGYANTLDMVGTFDFADPRLTCAAGLATYKDFDAATCTGHQNTKSSSPSFTAVLEKKLNPDTMAYATVRSGYLVGGFNNQVFVPGGFAQVFRPEKVIDGEIGLKSDWRLAGQPIRTNIAIFGGKYKNQQRVQNGTSSEGATFIAVQNAGKSHFYGADLEVIYSPAEMFEFSASYQYIRARYDEFSAALSIPGVNNAFVDYKGKKLSQTPDHVLNLSGTFKVPMSTDNGNLSATLTYFWRSKTTGHDAPTVSGLVSPTGELTTITEDFTQYDKLPSFGLLNLSVSWNRVMGSDFDLNFWVKNLTDKVYPVYQSNQMLQFGYATRSYGNPRELGLNLRYNF